MLKYNEAQEKKQKQKLFQSKTWKINSKQMDS